MKKRIMGLIASIALILNLSGCHISYGVNYEDENMISIDKPVEYDGQNEIYIDMKVGKIDICGYDGDKILITGKVKGGSENIKVEKDTNKVSIKNSNDKENDLNIFMNTDNVGVDIEIKIPKTFEGNIDLDYGAGHTIIHDLRCKNIEIEGGAGQLDIENIVFEKLDYDGGVGETNIKLTKKCGDIDIDGGVGSVNIEMSEVGGNFSFDGGVGSTKIKIPENAPVYFDTDSGIGNTKLTAKTLGEDIYKFEINVGVGEVEICN